MLKENVESLCEARGWSLRRLACNMSIKKKRLKRGLEEGANPELVRRIARAFGIPPVKLMRRPSTTTKRYTVNEDGSLTWH